MENKLKGHVAPLTVNSSNAQYYLVSLITFLTFFSVSSTFYLPVVLRENAFLAGEIGLLMAAIGPPMLVANLCAGLVIERFGAGRTIVIASAVIAASIASFAVSLDSFAAMLFARAALGFGVGLFTPAGMVCAKNALEEADGDFLFGIYTTMFTLPNLVGPAIAEVYLGNGSTSYFYVLAIAAILAAILAITLRNARDEKTDGRSSHSYLEIIRRRSMWAPLSHAVVASLLFGFPPAFVALALHDKSVHGVFFFSSWTVFLFLTRFLITNHLQGLGRKPLLCLSLVSLALSLLILIADVGAPLVILSGILFGFGHAIALPLISLWVADQFPPETRGKPMALLSALSNLAIYITPFLGGFILQHSSMTSLIVVLAGIGLSGCVFVVAQLIFHEKEAKRQ